jgi:2-dehydro-3-deoxyglucarate aldolase/4-hydroxy-2-oxoheptanedioate aldolase
MLFERFVPGIPRLMATTGAELASYDEEIAAIDGIDCLWVGHNDLSIQMGIPGQFSSTRFQDAIKRVADVADKHGKPAGVAASSVAMAEEWMAMGYRAIAFGADHRLFADSLKTGIDKVRTFVKQ